MIIDVVDSSDTTTYCLADESAFDSWHKFQIHKLQSSSTINLWIDGDSIGSYTSLSGDLPADTLLFGTTDTLQNGEGFWDDVIITTPPTGGHPRLLFGEDDIPWLRARADSTDTTCVGVSYADMWDSLQAHADGYMQEDSLLGLPFPSCPFPGESVNWYKFSMRLAIRLEILSFAYTITDSVPYAARVDTILHSLGNWPMWQEPVKSAYCDLATGHLSQAVSLAYDMVFGYLGDCDKMDVQNSLLVCGINQLYLYSFEPRGRNPHHPQGLNRYAVKNSSLGFASLACYDNWDGCPELDTAVARIDSLLSDSLVCGRDGGWIEGINYGGYSMMYVMPFIEADRRLTNNYSLYGKPYLEQHPYWRLYSLIPGGSKEINFCDSGDYGRFGYLFRLASEDTNRYAQWFLREAGEHHRWLFWGGYHPILPFLWLDADLEPQSPDSLTDPYSPYGHRFRDLGWCALRTGWDLEDFLLAFKSAEHAVGHCHFDNNTFILGTNDRWLLADRGYAYEDWERSSFAHNVVLVDSAGQYTRSGGTIADPCITSEYGLVVGDAGDCYESLGKWLRKIVLVNEESPFCVIKDEIESSDTTRHHIDWLLHTWGQVNHNQKDSIAIEVGDECVAVRLLLPPNTAIHDSSFLSEHSGGGLPFYWEGTGWSPGDGEKGTWHHIEVSLPDSVIEVHFLSAFLPYEDGQSPPSVEMVDGVTMVGARVWTNTTDGVVLFSSDGELVKSTSYVLDGQESTDTCTNILTDLYPNTAYAILVENLTSGGTPPDTVTADSLGTLRFDVPLPSGDHRISVYGPFPLESDTPQATATNSGRKLVYDKPEGEFHLLYQNKGGIFYSWKLADHTDSIPGIPIGRGAFPCIATTPAGDLCAVWLHGEDCVYYSRNHYGWEEPSPLVAMMSSDGIHMFPPSLAVDSGNKGHLAWEVISEPESYPGNITYELHHSTFDVTSTEPEIISDVVLDYASEWASSWTEPITSASITLIESQTPCVAWSRSIGAGKHDIYFKVETDTGWPSDPDTVYTSATLSLHPGISYNSHKQAVDMVWEEQGVDSSFEIGHKRRTTSKWTQVSWPSGGVPGDNSRFPMMDGLYCGWSQFYPDTYMTATEICYSALVSTDPPFWTPPENFSETPYDSSGYPHFIHDSGGDPPYLHGIWTDSDSTDSFEVLFESKVVPYDFSGHISCDTTWSNDIIITGDVWVDPGVILTIEAGVRALFMPHMDDEHAGVDTTRSELIIEGTLRTLGTETDSIEFTSLSTNPEPGDWYGIRYPEVGGLELSGGNTGALHSREGVAEERIKKSRLGLQKGRMNAVSPLRITSSGMNPEVRVPPRAERLTDLPDERTGMETNAVSREKNLPVEAVESRGTEHQPLAGGGQEVKYCLIEFAERGVWVADHRLSEIKNSTVSSCADAGVYLIDSHPEIRDNTIMTNGTGIYCGDESSPIVKENRILDNSSYGVYISDEATPNLGDEDEIGHNHIYGSGEYDVFNNTANEIKAERNYWGTMDPDSIAAHIWDYYDDPSLGIVDFKPFWGGEMESGQGPQSAGEGLATPKVFELSQNCPNPCGEFTIIDYQLPKTAYATLRVYDLAGRMVKTLADEHKRAGYYSIRWDERDQAGREIPPGVYFYRLVAGDFTATKKLVVLR